MEKQFEISASAKSNINSYNRYPFSCFDEAVINAKHKQLQPGEIAIVYYYDENDINGINAIIAIGNLKRAENIIFENTKYDIQQLNDRISKQKDVVNNIIDNLNHQTRVWSGISERVDSIEKISNTHYDDYEIPIIQLDLYDKDIIKK